VGPLRGESVPMEDSGAPGKEMWSVDGNVAPAPASCAGCSRPIRDQYIYRVLDRAWHAACIRCHDCGVALSEKCFSRDEILFCRDDFFRLGTPTLVLNSHLRQRI
jgi:hypothetical protein